MLQSQRSLTITTAVVLNEAFHSFAPPVLHYFCTLSFSCFFLFFFCNFWFEIFNFTFFSALQLHSPCPVPVAPSLARWWSRTSVEQNICPQICLICCLGNLLSCYLTTAFLQCLIPQTPVCCPSGMYTLDECGCCLTCAKDFGEKCGGPFQVDFPFLSFPCWIF